MNRPRGRNKKDLPPNLYTVGKGYYRYRHPQTGKFHGMGSDKAEAVREFIDGFTEKAAKDFLSDDLVAIEHTLDMLCEYGDFYKADLQKR